jgi:hypothetical protein
LKIPFQRCITRPQKKAAKEKRKIYSCLAIVDQGGKKNRNGKTTAILLRNVSYYTKYDI